MANSVILPEIYNTLKKREHLFIVSTPCRMIDQSKGIIQWQFDYGIAAEGMKEVSPLLNLQMKKEAPSFFSALLTSDQDARRYPLIHQMLQAFCIDRIISVEHD